MEKAVILVQPGKFSCFQFFKYFPIKCAYSNMYASLPLSFCISKDFEGIQDDRATHTTGTYTCISYRILVTRIPEFQKKFLKKEYVAISTYIYYYYPDTVSSIINNLNSCNRNLYLSYMYIRIIYRIQSIGLYLT